MGSTIEHFHRTIQYDAVLGGGQFSSVFNVYWDTFCSLSLSRVGATISSLSDERERRSAVSLLYLLVFTWVNGRLLTSLLVNLPFAVCLSQPRIFWRTWV